MKFKSRGVAALLLAAALSVQIVPIANAIPRERDDFSAKIVRFIKKLGGLIGLEDGPLPPRP